MAQTHGFKKAGIAECLFTLRKDGAACPSPTPRWTGFFTSGYCRVNSSALIRRN